MNKDQPPFRSTERWAHFRFSVIGSLLAAPPARGQLQAQLQTLADKTWRHPIGGHSFTLGFSTIERWYHKASTAKGGPWSLDILLWTQDPRWRRSWGRWKRFASRAACSRAMI